MQLPALNVGPHGVLYSRKATLSTAVGIIDSGLNCRTLACLFCACTLRCWPCSEFCVHHCAVCPLVLEHIGGRTRLMLLVCCNLLWDGTEKNSVPYVFPNNAKQERQGSKQFCFLNSKQNHKSLRIKVQVGIFSRKKDCSSSGRKGWVFTFFYIIYIFSPQRNLLKPASPYQTLFDVSLIDD